jgi:hypothetical protein
MSAILSKSEIEEITGYKRPGAQETELRRQGFFRARRAHVDGHVIVERRHYEAICGGARLSAANEPKVRVPQIQVPQVRTPKLHRVA